MKDLIKGLTNFREDTFIRQKDLFESLKNSQNPHTFFIGCSDSRIVPNLITHTLPGELFTIRNIANVMPPCSKNDGTFKCSAAALEYAVKYLEVDNIVVCGHSNCGGLKALFYPQEKIEKLPFVNKWLEIVRPLKYAVLDVEGDERAEKIEKLNILMQIDNLMSYDFVKEKVEKGLLNIYGWYYIIEKGEVYNYNFKKKEFVLIN